MKLVGVQLEDAIFVGALEGDSIRLIAPRPQFWSGQPSLDATQSLGEIALSEATLVPALPDSAKVICIGLNYKKHALEAKMPLPEKPVVFARWASTLIVDGATAPAMEPAFDWEVELGVVIGREGLAIEATRANDHVFGYCTANDLSCRSLQMESAQWALGKNSDASCPIGAVVSRDESGDPDAGWAATTHVNGELMQNGDTSDLIFSVPEIIAFVSRATTLKPGDLIITGTPSGVGVAMAPPRFLKAGDQVRVEVGPLGAVTTPIVARP